VAGLVFGPVWFISTWSTPRTTPHQRYASIVGFGTTVGLLGVTFVGANFLNGTSSWVPFMIMLAPMSGLAMIIVFASRYKNLPSFDRDTAGFFYQLVLIIGRSFVQQWREWLGILFDMFLPVAAGLFLGVIYFNRYYRLPMLAEFAPAYTCPENYLPEVCRFLELPQDDPIAGEASLTCVALGLAAMASSLRVFGSEKVVFQRESRGLSTEAYFLGKMIAHIPSEVAAPTVFLLCYYAFKLPPAPFWEYLFLYMLVYMVAAGIGFLISVIVPEKFSQLAGVLLILCSMMFSGSSTHLHCV
jgi:hypothetical protein